MAISIVRAIRHIEEWGEKLPGQSSVWPRYVYHTAHVTVIPEILRSGRIIPRGKQQNIIYDVAAEEPIARNPAAHQYSRFYFRPKTLFHVVKEGIRCQDDTKRTSTQMSIPIILMFDAKNILTLPTAHYTVGKFAELNCPIGSDEIFFDNMNFSDIYHNSATRDDNIRHARMSEVVVDGDVTIIENLKYILCRTPYDRWTLLSFLNNQEKAVYSELIKIEKTPQSFFVHEFALYIRDIKFHGGNIILSLKHPSVQGRLQGYKCRIKQLGFAGEILADNLYQLKIQFIPQILSGFTMIQDCSWEIFLDDQLAFAGMIPSNVSMIV